jgi:exosome complex component RRP42
MSSMQPSNLTKETLKKMFAEGKRFDGRGLLDLRDFEVEYDISYKAEGSARVRMGKTEVIVGVKMQLGEPYPDSADKGNLMVSADLLPLASPRYEAGPPKFNAIELPRLIDRMVRESGMIDLGKLCIKKGEEVWTVIVDIYPINDDGSIIDAASIGTIAALHNSKIPGIKDDRPDYENRTKNKLPLSKETMPLSFTFYKLGDSLLLNPTREEEESCDCKITWGISKWNKQYMLNSCQKGMETPFSRAEIEEMMKILPKKYDETIKKLGKFMK